MYSNAYRMHAWIRKTQRLRPLHTSQTSRPPLAWSEPRIAKLLGVSQPTVNRIVHGQGDCKSTTWMAIVELHRKVCSRAAAQCQLAGQPDQPNQSDLTNRNHTMSHTMIKRDRSVALSEAETQRRFPLIAAGFARRGRQAPCALAALFA